MYKRVMSRQEMNMIGVSSFVNAQQNAHPGKKKTVASLTGHQVALANPPICCLFCLPHVPFTKKYMLVHEWLILQLFIYQLVMGYIDLLIGRIFFNNLPDF